MVGVYFGNGVSLVDAPPVPVASTTTPDIVQIGTGNNYG